MLDDLWAEARPQVFWGVEAWTLSPEWELLYLAVHAARHRWQGLKWLVDIHEVCTRAKFDWDTVTDKAHRFGLERALEVSLSVCRALFGTPSPPGRDASRRHQLVGQGPVAVFLDGREVDGVWRALAVNSNCS